MYGDKSAAVALRTAATRARASSIGLITTTSNRSVYWWGRDQPHPEVIVALRGCEVQDVSSSGRHYAVVGVDGRVMTWGSGSSGQLGHGTKANEEAPKVVEFFVQQGLHVVFIECKCAQTAAITGDGQLFLWGWRGEQPVFSPERAPFPGGSKVHGVALGAYHAVALVQTPVGRRVFTWGMSDKGQLGHGGVETVLEPTTVAALEGVLATDVAAGETISAVISNTGEVFVWGSNTNSSLGLGPSCTESFVSVPTKISAFEAMPLSAIAFGVDFGVALTDSGDLYSWGKNSEGQLGLGDQAPRDSPALIPGLVEEDVIGVSCGSTHVSAWTSYGDIFTWGCNQQQRLGHSNITASFVAVPTKLEDLTGKLVFEVSCGVLSLACLGVATIDVEFHDKKQKSIVTEHMTVAHLKNKLAVHWNVDANSVVVQTKDGLLLSPTDDLRRLITEKACNTFIFVEKVHAKIHDSAQLKFDFNENDFPVVKAGTPEALLAWLTNTRYPIEDYIEDFLISYRKFLDPPQLLSNLRAKYETFSQDENYSRSDDSQTFKIQQDRVLYILRTWITKYHADFFNPTEDSRRLLLDLHDFIENVIPKYDEKAAIDLTRLYHRMNERSKGRGYRPTLAPPEPCGKIKSSSGSVGFRTYPALEIARQLCLLAFSNFKKIEPKELLECGWTKEDKHQRAPNVLKMIYQANNTSHWVSETILSQSSQRKKIKAYEKFVDIGAHLLTMNNFSSLMEVLGGLHSTAVLREQKNWTESSVSSRHMQIVDEWSQMMIAHNRSVLREKLRTVDPPCIPFLGMFLTDIIHIDDGNKNKVDGDLVNFRKCSLLATVIRSIQKFQTIGYNFSPVPALYAYLQNAYSHAHTAIPTSEQEKAGSVESQLIFIEKKSEVLVDRHKHQDLDGERQRMWAEWCESLEDLTTTYESDQGGSCSFLDIFLQTRALERSLQSCMIAFPKSEVEMQLLKRLCSLCFVDAINVEEAVDLLRLARTARLPAEQRENLAVMLGSFKTVQSVKPKAVALKRQRSDTRQLASAESDELSAYRGKRKKVNRAAVKLVQQQQQLAMLLSEAESIESVSKCDPKLMDELRQCFEVIGSALREDIDKMTQQKSSQLSLKETTFQSILQEHASVEKLETEIKGFAERKGELLQRSKVLTRAVEKAQQNSAAYQGQVRVEISLKQAQAQQLDAAQRLLNLLTESHNSRALRGVEVAFEKAQTVATRLEEFADAAYEAYDTWLCKLDAIVKDMTVMGSKYGAAVVEAMKKDYGRYKEAFILNSVHLGHAVAVLNSLLRDSQLYPAEFGDRLGALLQKFERVSQLANSIETTHCSA